MRHTNAEALSSEALAGEISRRFVARAVQRLSRDLPQLNRSVLRASERELHRRLTEVWRPCVTVRFNAYRGAFLAIRGPAAIGVVQQAFLAREAAKLPEEFPELKRLSARLASQWQRNACEIIKRFKRDRALIARRLCSSRPLGRLRAMRIGLSDAHDGGRTVALLRFERGCVIYKPRRGDADRAWMALVEWAIDEIPALKLKTAWVLRRPGYCWMEYMRPSRCRTDAQLDAYFYRAGALLCLAQLTGIVDCHKENVAVAGSQPVLVDAEARLDRGRSSAVRGSNDHYDPVRTGWLPHGRGISPLEKTDARARARIVAGYTTMWNSLLRERARRASLRRRLQRWSRIAWRLVLRPTSDYAAICAASLHPALMQSRDRRRDAIEQWLRSTPRSADHIEEEIRALHNLDIPRFYSDPAGDAELPDVALLGDYVQAIEAALHSGPASSAPSLQ